MISTPIRWDMHSVSYEFGSVRKVFSVQWTQETEDVRFKRVSGFREHFREMYESLRE